MRISDWSSDVCSSDLLAGRVAVLGRREQGAGHQHQAVGILVVRADGVGGEVGDVAADQAHRRAAAQHEAVAARKSVASGKSVSVGVDLGGRLFLKQNNNTKQLCYQYCASYINK